MIDPQVIAKRLREARETTKDESTALTEQLLSLIHISEPTRLLSIAFAVFGL